MQKVGDSSAPNLAFWNHLSSTGIDDWAKLHNSGWDCDGLFPTLSQSGNTYSTTRNRPLHLMYINSIDHGSHGSVLAGFTTEVNDFLTA